MKKIFISGIIVILFVSAPFSIALTGNMESLKDVYLSNDTTRLINMTNQNDETHFGYILINYLDTFGGRAKLIDMNAKRINSWYSLFPSVYSFPAKLLPDEEIIVGKIPTFLPYLINLLIGQKAGHAFALNQYLVQLDWKGTTLWNFKDWDDLKVDFLTIGRSAMQHHDFQREGNPVGYYAPGQDFVKNGKTLILAHKDLVNSSISDKTLHDDVIYEVDWDGTLTGFVWYANEHFDEFGFDENAKDSIRNYPGLGKPDVEWFKDARLQGFGEGDWLHINSVTRLGKNKWYDQDPITYSHFHPNNLMIDSRHANFIAIIDNESGNIVWKLGPDFENEPGNIGQIIGPHMAHIIPYGLPGAGNILVFDNGGAAGYGSIPGQPNKYRNYSRVIEFNPVTKEIVWEYKNKKTEEVDDTFRHHWKNISVGPNHHFFSPYVSSAQRLPNGNTLITEGFRNRVFEVKTNGTIHWDYVTTLIFGSIMYRAYKIPPEWTKNNPSGYEFWENN